MSGVRQRFTHQDGRPSRPPPREDDNDEDSVTYNIIPIHNHLADHPSLRFPEVRAAIAALRTVGDLRRPPFVQWRDSMDILDWLGVFFGFQSDSVRNQREHLVLLLANAQMRIQPPPDDIDALDPSIVRKLRKKLLRNYTDWCAFLGRPSNIWISSAGRSPDERRELLYVSLFLLIWGEAANLRFMPECLCYIFHHMAMELNRILEGYIDENTGNLAVPQYMGENAFLLRVVTPFYQTVKAEVDSSRNGTQPHSVWRNYDDINEYFWSERCFTQVGWPLNLSSSFFIVPPPDAAAQQQRGIAGFQPPEIPTSGRAFRKGKAGKTGFVEQRSFLNLFRSFDRLWIMHILFFQAALLVAWDETRYPWQAFTKDPQLRVKVLSIFITWAGLRLLQSLLDAGLQYSLISRGKLLLGVRMLLKIVIAAGWTLAFLVMYLRIWAQRNRDRGWSASVKQRERNYYYAAAVFVAPEALAVALFVIPWARNFIERTNWKVFSVVTWWFQSRIFVGRGLREGILDNVAYTAFWGLVLATKFMFSYFLQIKPMVAPTKSILSITNVQYRWHEFLRGSNRLAVVLLWAPVVIIYLMDISIWYSIYSSLTGALVGLFSHLGEIRNLQQLRLRFQFFASAMQFNLMPEEQHFKVTGTFKNKFQNFIRRLKLRYGYGKPYKKIESSQVEATKFALIWNEIIGTFREEDIISDQEVELLELPANAWGIRVVRWPCLLLCNELLLALGQAKELTVPDRTLWRKICKNEYRRCSVMEAYDSVKFLLLKIIKEETQEHAIVSTIFREIDAAINSERFCASYHLKKLMEIHEKLIVLVKVLLEKPGDKDPRKMQKVVNMLQTLYDISLRDLPQQKRSIKELMEDGLVVDGNSGLLFENAVEIPDPESKAFFYRQLRRLYTILTSRDSMHNVPKNLEARRRIAFFSNSLFMNMPRAPQVEKMLSFSVLTPYYDEDVMYTKEQLEKGNADGVSTLFYLQRIFPDEWQNFLERMKRNGTKDPKIEWTEKDRELRLWASYRGQTLARTVRGMMYYYKALKMLTFLDSASEVDVQQGSRELAAAGSATFSFRMENAAAAAAATAKVSSRSASSRSLSREGSGVSMLFKGHEYGTVSMKFTYVVSCQIYGEQKKKKDPRANDILFLMENNEALRIAYVDEVEVGREKKNYFSVLVKYDRTLQKEVEIYRVMLPGPMKLGEGKPENQNQSFIFTRGNAVQTIDMNQDNYFEEALKVRNLLEEYNRHYGIRKPTILGVREHIFTASVSSLAWFMSAQETSFVTLGQRVLAWPLKVRMHYGHPDVFDRLWFLNRGGISKASRVINISEDIFAGFNCTLRGGNVTHHEYIQVGKGRDVGLNQISMFEAKVASGNGEQVLSRDVYRLGHRLDFLRMMSFYYTTVGFFFNTMMVVLTVYAFLWGRLYLCLSGIESSIMSQASKNKAFTAALNQQFIIQLGLFTALPMIVENSLEHGFLAAVWDFLMMQLQFASVFYTFSMGTRTHFFGRTILHGGAKYRATGRGFVVEHKKFAENYRLYARSHFIKGIELGVILLVYASYSSVANFASNTAVYILMMLSSWFLVVSWIMAPFMFNPTGFDWLKTVYDFDDFMNWIWFRGGVNVKADQSWEKWWYEEQDHLKNTGLWGKMLEVLLNFRYFFFQYGIVYQLEIVKNKTSIWVYLISWVYVIVVLAVYVIISWARDRYSAKQHIYYRAIQSFVVVLMVLILILLLELTSFKFVDALMSLLAFVPTGWGLISIALVFRPLLEKTILWNAVVALARSYDILFGVIVMAPTALLSWLPGFQSMQTRILFNDAFSRGLHINRILAGTKSNVEW